MTWLIDTHLLLWAALGSPRLPRRARAILEDPSHRLMFSAASTWEVATKSATGRLDVDVARLRRGLLESGYDELPITGEHAVMVRSLAHLHTDPFDRMLVAQTIVEDVTLLTSDARVAAYHASVELVRASR